MDIQSQINCERHLKKGKYSWLHLFLNKQFHKYETDKMQDITSRYAKNKSEKCRKIQGNIVDRRLNIPLYYQSLLFFGFPRFWSQKYRPNFLWWTLYCPYLPTHDFWEIHWTLNLSQERNICMYLSRDLPHYWHVNKPIQQFSRYITHKHATKKLLHNTHQTEYIVPPKQQRAYLQLLNLLLGGGGHMAMLRAIYFLYQ